MTLNNPLNSVIPVSSVFHKKVVIIGPGHPLRGGLATFNQRLAKEFLAHGDDCYICSFSLQYPSFLFPGKTQYSDEPAPDGIVIHSVINSINPFNWIKVGNRLKNENTNKYVGRAKINPDSRTPRRLRSISRPITTAPVPSLWLFRKGKAEAMFSTPAAIDTDTVRM